MFILSLILLYFIVIILNSLLLHLHSMQWYTYSNWSYHHFSAYSLLISHHIFFYLLLTDLSRHFYYLTVPVHLGLNWVCIEVLLYYLNIYGYFILYLFAFTEGCSGYILLLLSILWISMCFSFRINRSTGFVRIIRYLLRIII